MCWNDGLFLCKRCVNFCRYLSFVCTMVYFCFCLFKMSLLVSGTYKKDASRQTEQKKFRPAPSGLPSMGIWEANTGWRFPDWFGLKLRHGFAYRYVMDFFLTHENFSLLACASADWGTMGVMLKPRGLEVVVVRSSCQTFGTVRSCSPRLCTDEQTRRTQFSEEICDY